MATPRFLPDTGGVENHVHEVARRLPEYGIDVFVVATGAERGLPPHDCIEGTRVVRVRSRPRRGDIGFAPSVIPALRGADVIHVQSYHTMLAPLAMSAALAKRVPFAVTFHGGGHSSALRSKLRPAQIVALRPLLRRARTLVAVAQFEITTYGRLLGLGPERFKYIPNGADLPHSGSVVDRDPKLIVSIGRLERYKGHHRVIEALPCVLANEPEAQLWIAGSGPYEAELRRLAARLGVAERVRFGAIPANERKRYADELSRARVAILLSEFETHPIAALEAAALGLSVIVTEGSGMTALIRDGVATGVPLTAEAGTAAATIVAALRSPPAPALPSLATWDDCARSLAGLYRAIARGPRSES